MLEQYPCCSAREQLQRMLFRPRRTGFMVRVRDEPSFGGGNELPLAPSNGRDRIRAIVVSRCSASHTPTDSGG